MAPPPELLVDADRFQIVLADCGEGQVVGGHDRHWRAVRGVDAEGRFALDQDRFHEGDIVETKRRQIGRRQRAQFFDDVGVHDATSS